MVVTIMLRHKIVVSAVAENGCLTTVNIAAHTNGNICTVFGLGVLAWHGAMPSFRCAMLPPPSAMLPLSSFVKSFFYFFIFYLFLFLGLLLLFENR